MSAHVDIGRLRLRIPGIREPDARLLVRLVAERLAGAQIDHAFTCDDMRFGLAAVSDESLDSLARRIAAAVLSNTSRSA